MPWIIRSLLLAALASGVFLSDEVRAEEEMKSHPGRNWRLRLENATKSPQAWKDRCEQIRLQILTSAGLFPEFERHPLKSEVSGWIEREGYSIQNVRIETWPGFWLTGNLYRPLTPGPHPAVLSPHGHWKPGRFNDTDIGSVPGRAIGLARLGCVVFTYDMVGYGDFTQLPHEFSDVIWGLNLLGLQLWNSLRAVDFLVAQEDVDSDRIGVTGASGGGTQTFLLTAVDRRIACAAPVNMVAAACQGGCSCENAPLLRIDLNNVEIAAATAPRPLLTPSCTGDWTMLTPHREGPALGRVYERLGVPGRFRWTQTDAEHNYNRETREYVYAWFARWFFDRQTGERLEEQPFEVEPQEALSVYPDGVPKAVADADSLKMVLKEIIRAQLDGLWPRDRAGLKQFRKLMLPALRATLSAHWPLKGEFRQAGPRISYRFLPGELTLARHDRERELTVLFPEDAARLPRRGMTMILSEHDQEPPCNAEEEMGDKDCDKWQFNFPLTYHRTELARQVQDILVATAAMRGGKVKLTGLGRAGVPVLLARALIPADRVALATIDLNGMDDRKEESWTGDWAHPGILRVGGLRTAAVLTAPGELKLRGAANFDTDTVKAAYRAAGRENSLIIE